MTLEAKNKLICDLIRENPDSTIKDYQYLLNDIESIEAQVIKEPTKLKKVQRRDLSGKIPRCSLDTIV